MRLLIAAVGRLRGGPEADLTADYLARAGREGRALGLGPCDLVELESKPPGDGAKEAALLRAAAPAGARTILLDETGAAWPSRLMAEKIASWRDGGRPAACFWIGGADGAGPGLREAADEILAFGPQTWPHRLVRAMLAEQIYRSVTILGLRPYHRD